MTAEHSHRQHREDRYDRSEVEEIGLQKIGTRHVSADEETEGATGALEAPAFPPELGQSGEKVASQSTQEATSGRPSAKNVGTVPNARRP